MCNTTLALDQPIWPIAGLRDDVTRHVQRSERWSELWPVDREVCNWRCILFVVRFKFTFTIVVIFDFIVRVRHINPLVLRLRNVHPIVITAIFLAIVSFFFFSRLAFFRVRLQRLGTGNVVAGVDSAVSFQLQERKLLNYYLYLSTLHYTFFCEAKITIIIGLFIRRHIPVVFFTFSLSNKVIY